MKYIKTYEYKINRPKINDYVICHFKDEPLANPQYWSTYGIDKSLEYKIGLVKKTVHSAYNETVYIVEYIQRMGEEFRMYWDKKTDDQHYDGVILHFSDDLEEMKSMLDAMKYNL